MSLPTASRVATVLFFAISLLLSCSEPKKKESKTDRAKKTIKDGLAKAHYENGKVRTEINYKDGKKDGIAREYYEEGGLFQEISYKNGIKDGLAKRFHKNGKLYQSTEYKLGKQEGIQLKFREDGSAASEARFSQDEPCMGLVEYTLEGVKKKKYPTIVISPVDNILKDNTYTLRISLSDKVGSVEYYTGSLTKDGCLGGSVERIWSEDSDSPVVELEYYIPRGRFIMETVNIIARVKTPLGNHYVMQRSYNVAAENR